MLIIFNNIIERNRVINYCTMFALKMIKLIVCMRREVTPVPGARQGRTQVASHGGRFRVKTIKSKLYRWNRVRLIDDE